MWLLILNGPCIQIWSSHDNEIMQDYVYVSFHPTIYICLRGIPSPTLSSLCYLSHLIILIFVAPYQEWTLAMFWANLYDKTIFLKMQNSGLVW